MCGICGIYDPGGSADLETVERMCEAIRHRGPDDGGSYVSRDHLMALGNRRLAVIDLTPAGHMPMSSADGRYTITYNGEVYNFVSLRSELEAKGHRFRSGTDTEVVVHLYAEYGERCVERLNGMFAFAIWDATERCLFLARDRMGIKPLYFTFHGETLFFASEVRALLASGVVSRVADREAIAGYLAFGAVPDDRTIIAGVDSFPPAHFAIVRDGRMRMRRYWSHARELQEAPQLPEDEIEDVLREGLKATVRRQIVSDAPLGLFLSGGMDSGTLAALMRAAGHPEIRSVSISFDETAFDESEGASKIAERFGLDHTDYRITASEVAEGLDGVIASMDQPTADGVNAYFVSQAAHGAGLTVALSGLGADELFGGYTSFGTVPRVQRLMRTVQRVPRHDLLLGAVAAMPGVPYRARKLARWTNGSSSLEAAYAAVRGVVSPGTVRALIGPSDFSPEEYVILTADRVGLGETDAVSLLESRIYMHNQLLRDTDAMSMAHSLEVRVPFLDDEIVRLAARSRGMLSSGRKAALAAARSIYFPIALPAGPKQGFSFPFQRWIAGPLAARVRDSLARPGVLDRGAAMKTWDELLSGRRHWSSVWAMSVLQEWMAAHEISEAT